MLILSRVCADFYDKRNTLLFRITQHDIGLFVDAPEAIREDPLFQMLVNDNSIKFPEDAKTNRALENDPYAGATAEGREIGAASGGNDADFEVNRNKRAVRGTVTPIEVAEQEISETKETKVTKPRTVKSKADSKVKPKEDPTPESISEPNPDPADNPAGVETK